MSIDGLNFNGKVNVPKLKIDSEPKQAKVNVLKETPKFEGPKIDTFEPENKLTNVEPELDAKCKEEDKGGRVAKGWFGKLIGRIARSIGTIFNTIGIFIPTMRVVGGIFTIGGAIMDGIE